MDLEEEDEYLRRAVLRVLYLCRREDVDKPDLGSCIWSASWPVQKLRWSFTSGI